MKIFTVLGARPQFIKAATVSRAIKARNDIQELIVHTGQHFDASMSDVFFEQLDIPRPNYNLGIASLSHGAMTGRMIEALEELVKKEKPDLVLVYGDTNSTLAGALASVKLGLTVAHIEAGLRSHNPTMPEEINRVLTDRVSSLLLCPSDTAIKNLKEEGFPFRANKNGLQRIYNVGDVMLDSVIYYRELAKRSVKLTQFGLVDKSYVLCTLHRQENTDSKERLSNIIDALRQIARDIQVVMPLHPRTKAKFREQFSVKSLKDLNILEPVPYLQMQRLQMSARAILTDSGGVQKEAYFHKVPCITLRDETEWMETVDESWNKLVGADPKKIIEATLNITPPSVIQKPLYGDGKAADQILQALSELMIRR